MPAQLELTGQRYGSLLVIEQAGRIKFGRMQTGWRCRCECGRVEVLAQDLLTRRDWQCCSLCRRPQCVVCKRRIPIERARANTCSDDCATAKRRKTDLEHYYRRVEQDPEHNRRRHAERLHKLQADPQAWAAYKAAEHARAQARWQQTKGYFGGSEVLASLIGRGRGAELALLQLGQVGHGHSPIRSINDCSSASAFAFNPT